MFVQDLLYDYLGSPAQCKGLKFVISCSNRRRPRPQEEMKSRRNKWKENGTDIHRRFGSELIGVDQSMTPTIRLI